jgi:hypothetical protein
VVLSSKATVLALGLAVALQFPPTPPPMPSSGRARDSTHVDRAYGTAEAVDLWDLSYGKYHRHTVTTRGRLRTRDLRNGYFELAEEQARVLLFAVPEIESTLARFVGKRVEVVGLARDLVEAQGMCLSRAQRVPQSVCDDPALPATPDLTPDRIAWPRVSITVWSITDVSPADAREAEVTSGFGGSPGAKVRLRGLFGGANLDRALATGPPEQGAWVLRDGGQGLWILGKPPRGNGWSLDPAYRGDLGKQLEVEGTLVRCAAGTCLRARRVHLGAIPPS